MRALEPLTMSHWELGPCAYCNHRVIRMWTDPDLPALELRPSTEQAAWLMRARHPSYHKRTTALIDELAKKVLKIELRDCGGGVVAPIATTWRMDHLQTIYLAIAPSLHLATRTLTPFLIDPSLLAQHPTDHYDELQMAFKDFVAEVSPESFRLPG